VLIKILSLYYHNIISHFELVELVKSVLGPDLVWFTDITESRAISRRRNSLFKPLSDIDFHILPRETHSYVEMPATYPHSASNRPSEVLAILNNKWVSVARGS
jgi:histone deacetylase complex regulatory component SIN3